MARRVALGKLLAQLGLTPQKPLQRAYQRDPEAISRWQSETCPRLAKDAKARGADIYFWDESEFRADGVQGREDLPIPYTAVAVDLDTQREVWMSRGSLFDAIRASIATPTIFRPYRYHGRVLVDGGLLNPVPVSATLRDLTDCMIAVDVNALAEPLDAEATARAEALLATDRAALAALEDDDRGGRARPPPKFEPQDVTAPARGVDHYRKSAAPGSTNHDSAQRLCVL